VLPQLYYPSQVHALIAHMFPLCFLALCLASILSPGQFYAIVPPFQELKVLALVEPEGNPAQRQPKHQGCHKQLLLNLQGQGAAVR